MSGEELIFFSGPLQGPVHVVQLNLAELHILAAVVQEFFQSLHLRMAGKTQVLNSAQALLLLEIVQNVPFGVHVDLHGFFVDVVQQVEVEVVHAAFFQLFLKDFGGVIAIAENLVTGVLGGEVIAVPGVFAQHPAHHPLGLAAMVGIGGVEVIHPGLHGHLRHAGDLRLVDGAVRKTGQPHGPKAQQR